jgi:hypothetical protein
LCVGKMLSNKDGTKKCIMKPQPTIQTAHSIIPVLQTGCVLPFWFRNRPISLGEKKINL